MSKTTVSCRLYDPENAGTSGVYIAPFLKRPAEACQVSVLCELQLSETLPDDATSVREESLLRPVASQNAAQLQWQRTREGWTKRFEHHTSVCSGA